MENYMMLGECMTTDGKEDQTNTIKHASKFKMTFHRHHDMGGQRVNNTEKYIPDSRVGNDSTAHCGVAGQAIGY